MKFRTEVRKADPFPVIAYSHKILCIGSCFAEHLHQRLTYLKYDSFLNPMGITYNPISISNSLYSLLGQTEFQQAEIFEHQGIFSHFDYHSDFSATSKEGVIEKIKKQSSDLQSYVKPDVLILSLGSAYVYERVDNGEVVNNCHKIPQKHFRKRLLEVDEVIETLDLATSAMKKDNSSLTVIATVSPVRHLRDGIHENNLSKATLLLALTKLKEVVYFPSYELLVDDLRDYRFYDRDLVHPSSFAVDYILDFFEGQCLSEKENTVRNRIKAIQKKRNHRAFFPDSKEHLNFLVQLIEEMKTMEEEFGVDFNKEIMEASLKVNPE